MNAECIARLTAIGISYEDAYTLRRIAMTLHNWHEKECGIDNGCIERDEDTGVTYWLNSYSGKRYKIADRETGAQKRLNKVMANYPGYVAYVQGDPRGASLYILRPTDILEGHSIDSYYSRGIAVYK